MANYVTRRAKIQDAAGLTDCIVDAYAKYSGQISDLPDVSVGVDEDIRDNLVWVVEHSGRVVGGLILVVDGKIAKLANVAVHSTATGQGLGRKLIDLAISECRALGVAEVRLATHAQMPDNIAIYERLGWEISDRRGNTVLMSRNL